MHPRNLYRTPPDFLALAQDYPALKPQFVKYFLYFMYPDRVPSVFTTANGVSAINFKDDAAQRPVSITQGIVHILTDL